MKGILLETKAIWHHLKRTMNASLQYKYFIPYIKLNYPPNVGYPRLAITFHYIKLNDSRNGIKFIIVCQKSAR